MSKILNKLSFVAKIALLLLTILSVWLAAYYLKEQMKPKEPLKIAISNWVGYMPIVYAKEKEWLNDNDIQLLWTESLKTTSASFDRHLVDGMFVTQYDYAINQKETPSSLVFVTNISKGADTIMSNVALDELRNSDRIVVSLEKNSLGQAMFDGFVAKYDLNASKFLLSNSSQLGIAEAKYTNSKAVVITYPPYTAILKSKGFSEITNAKELKLPVLDGLFVSDEKISLHAKTLAKIKVACERAISDADKNPMQFYQTVKPYLGSMSYDEFMFAVGGIDWAGKNNTAEIDAIIGRYKIKTIGIKQ